MKGYIPFGNSPTYRIHNNRLKIIVSVLCMSTFHHVASHYWIIIPFYISLKKKRIVQYDFYAKYLFLLSTKRIISSSTLSNMIISFSISDVIPSFLNVRKHILFFEPPSSFFNRPLFLNVLFLNDHHCKPFIFLSRHTSSINRLTIKGLSIRVIIPVYIRC